MESALNLLIQEIVFEFVYSRQQKMKTFQLKQDNSKLRVEVIILTFLNAVATEDILTASDNDVKPVKTQTEHFEN